MVYKLYLNRAAKKLPQILNVHNLTNKCLYHTDTLLQGPRIPSLVYKVRSSHLRPFGTMKAKAGWPSSAALPHNRLGEEVPLSVQGD